MTVCGTISLLIQTTVSPGRRVGILGVNLKLRISTITRRGVEMRLVLEGAGAETAKPDPALIKAVARAHKWFDDLLNGRARSLGDIAKTEGVSDRYISHLLPLAFLAPDIVEAILAGGQPVELTAETLTKCIDLPLDWTEQKAMLSFD